MQGDSMEPLGREKRRPCLHLLTVSLQEPWDKHPSSCSQSRGEMMLWNESIFKRYIYIYILFLIGGWLLYNIALFSAMYQHESAIGLCMSPSSWASLPSPTPSHPSGLSQSSGFELPASYSKFPLALYFKYGDIYWIHLCNFLFWIRVYLIHSVVLASGMQQSDSVIM